MHFDTTFITQTIPSAFIRGTVPEYINFSVDSRNIQAGDIFIAIKGAACDGHDFIEQALQNGASGIVIALKFKDQILQTLAQQLKNKLVIALSNPEVDIIHLASTWRQKFSIPVIGITGTVGKTTTKEIIKTVLQHAKIPALVSFGNQNTLIGASMNILKMTDEHQVAVFEMGISEIGSMQELAVLVRPTCAVITMVGRGHMQGLGTIANIAHEKRAIFSLFNEQNVGIINGDQKELAAIGYKHPVIRFGKKNSNQIQVQKIKVQNNALHCFIKIYKKKYAVVLQTTNQSRIFNALAAIAVGKILNIADEILIEAVQKFSCADRRFQFIRLNHECELIDDAYNANPESMKASLLAFDQYQTERDRVLVLGDMLELAEKSALYHRNIGRLIGKLSRVDCVILIGQQSLHIAETMPKYIQCYHFNKVKDAADLLKNMLLRQNKIFLLKASCSMGFISLVKQLQTVS